MNKIIYAFFISLVLSVAVTAYSDGIQEDLQDNIVRLHILADSDSEADQEVKLKVRDAILKDTGEKMKTQSKSEIIADLSEIEETANRVLTENGFGYGAKAVYGKFDFPEKTYKDMTLPTGKYYGVRVILGSGKGHNWWCVMYPPLCVSGEGAFMDEKSRALLRDSLNKETYDVITQSGGETVIKFKVVEFIQELRQKAAKAE